MIAILTWAIAGLGSLLLFMLFLRIRGVDAEAQLRRHRAKTAGLADLLNYAAVVDEGILVGKNGALMAAWLYQGADNASSTEPEREAVSYRLNQALAGLGNGWMLHVDAVRRPAPGYPERALSHFPDPVSEAIDEERRRLFERLGTLYEGYFVLTVTWFPPLLVQRRFVELLFEDDTEVPDAKARTRGLIAQFERELLNLESRLSAAVTLTRLRGQVMVNEDGSSVTHDEFLSWLQFCVTGLHHPVQLPSAPMYLDALIGGQALWGGVVPKIGRQFLQVVAIEGFPLESTPGILSALAELPGHYRWSSRFIFLDPHEAVRHLEKFRKKWRQKVRGFFDQVFNTHVGPIDQDALSMVNDAEAAMAEVNSGFVAMGYYTSVVVLMDADRARLEHSARQVEKAIQRLGFAARVETLNTLEAFLGSLPGHGVENVRRPLINTLNLADLLPTSAIWTGSAEAPCPLYPPLAPALLHGVTQGATPFRLNLHVRDLGHTLMLGPTGAGKSTHLGLIAAQLRRYRGMSIFAFDKGLSLLIALAGVGGMIHIGSQSRFIPYVIEVDKLGQARAAGPLTAAAKADPRVIHASVAEFITDARLVTPDVALQRQAVFRVYAKLAASDPATAKMNEWLNATPESSPFKRAATVMVGIDIQSVLPQSPDTWQVDWLETTRDRQGLRQGAPVTMRALVTVYTAEPTSATTEPQLRLNPLGIYVRDFAWSRRL